MGKAEEKEPLERIAAALEGICASSDTVPHALDKARSSSPSKTEEAKHDNCESDKVDRAMRIWFGIGLLLLTTFFTLAFMWMSYSIAVRDGAEGWKTPEVAIAALMIATPIQFVVLLCVVASCVFPRRKETAAPPQTS